MKRILQCLLIVSALLLVFMSAAAADTLIKFAQIDITEPKLGQRPSFNAKLVGGTLINLDGQMQCYIATNFSNSNYVNGVAWFDVTEQSWMTSTDTFKGGHTYSAAICLRSRSGYTFYSNAFVVGTEIDVNSKRRQGVAYDASTVIVWSENFDLPLPVTHVSFSGITAPVAGAAPSYNVTVDGTGYETQPYNTSMSRNGVYWFDETEDRVLKPSSGETFQAGHQYTVRVVFQSISGYIIQEGYTGTINGKTATVEGTHPLFCASLTFDTLPEAAVPVSNVSFSITAPAAGAAPSYHATASGTGYEVEAYNGTHWKNGVMWRDNTTGDYLSPDSGETFKAGHQYSVEISFIPKSGYTISGSCTSKINGKAAETKKYSDGTYGAKLAFDKLPEATAPVSNVSFSITAPAAGAAPSYHATADGTGYEVEAYNSTTWKNGVRWQDVTDNYYIPSASSDTFQAGHQYAVTISFIPKSGYTISGSCAGTINGKAATIRDYDDGTYGAELAFDKLPEAAVSVSNVSFTITAPAAGAAPSYHATANGTGYEVEAYNSTNWKNGVSWHDETVNDYLVPFSGETFKAGRQYRVEISFIPKSGYVIQDGFTATINGKAATTRNYHDGTYGAELIFNKLPSGGGQSGYTGFMQYNGGLYYFENGVVDTSVNGLKNDPNHPSAWYYCALGRAQTQYTGLAFYDGEWFYVSNGLLDTAKAGLVTYDGGRFMIAAGRILREYNGLIMEPNTGKWYYVAAGQVADYTGLVLYDGAWFYVINGELATGYTGRVQYDGAWFDVVGGQVV